MGNPHPRFGERRLMLIILGASFAAYALTFLLVAFTRNRQPIPLADSDAQPRVRWMPPAPARTADTRYAAADLLDPSLMSLPSAPGFTGKMWIQGPSPTHQPMDWGLAPALLAAPASNEVDALLPEMPLAALVQSAAEKTTVDIPQPPSEPPWPPAANHSVMRVSAELQDRNLLNAPAWPTVTSETPLQPTTVRVAVAADGVVRYTVLERGCGNDAVDARALELARQIHWELLPADASQTLTWAMLQFFWATQPPAPATAGK